MSKRHHTKSVSKYELRIRQDVHMIVEMIKMHNGFLEIDVENTPYWVYHFKPSEEVKRRVNNALKQLEIIK